MGSAPYLFSFQEEASDFRPDHSGLVVLKGAHDVGQAHQKSRELG